VNINCSKGKTSAIVDVVLCNVKLNLNAGYKTWSQISRASNLTGHGKSSGKMFLM
jgi:hypothetical protein